MDRNVFQDKSYTIDYIKHRLAPPQQLIEKIVQYTQKKISGPLVSAVDVGCGSGQCTLALSPHFQHVLGTDISENQIVEARKVAQSFNNVRFSVAAAEQLPVEDGTVQLVTAANCIHYLDAEKFYTEVQRVLVPNGVLAVFGHLFPAPGTSDQAANQEIEKHLQLFHDAVFVGNAKETRDTVEQGFSYVRQSFTDVERTDMAPSHTCSVADYRNVMTVLSPYRRYASKNGVDAAEQLLSSYIKKVLDILQSSETEEKTMINLRVQYNLLLATASQLKHHD